jgi:DNA-binding NarL/FixJ family response regulator
MIRVMESLAQAIARSEPTSRAAVGTAAATDTDMTTIALVEDNAAYRRNLERLLNRTPRLRCVCMCCNGTEALQKIPALAPNVVLMDIHLPDMSGIECAAALTQQMPALQIIMLTVYEDTEKIFGALKAGACGYLLKRSAPDEILQAIAEVREGGAPMTSAIARKVVQAFREPSAATAGSATLSPREQEILTLLAQGLVNKEVADRLSISYQTVKVHLKHIYEKLHVRTRTEAVLKFTGERRP